MTPGRTASSGRPSRAWALRARDGRTVDPHRPVGVHGQDGARQAAHGLEIGHPRAHGSRRLEQHRVADGGFADRQHQIAPGVVRPARVHVHPRGRRQPQRGQHGHEREPGPGAFAAETAVGEDRPPAPDPDPEGAHGRASPPDARAGGTRAGEPAWLSLSSTMRRTRSVTSGAPAATAREGQQHHAPPFGDIAERPLQPRRPGARRLPDFLRRGARPRGPLRMLRRELGKADAGDMRAAVIGDTRAGDPRHAGRDRGAATPAASRTAETSTRTSLTAGIPAARCRAVIDT